MAVQPIVDTLRPENYGARGFQGRHGIPSAVLLKGQTMSDRQGRDDATPSQPPPPEDAELSRRLRDLERRLGENRPARTGEVEASDAQPKPGWGMALRLGA